MNTVTYSRRCLSTYGWNARSRTRSSVRPSIRSTQPDASSKLRNFVYGMGYLAWKSFLAVVVLALFRVEQGLGSESTDRPIAEWVLRQGGFVVLERDAQAIWDVAELPSGNLRLQAVGLVGTLVDPTQLEVLSRLSSIQELYLPASMWNPKSDSKLDANEEFRHLGNLVSLEKLHISHHFLETVHIEDKGLAHLAGLTNLHELRLGLTKIKGSSLAPFKDLRSLDLTFTRIDDAGLKSVSSMGKLSKLHIGDTLVSDDGLQHLGSLLQLVELDLHGTRVSDTGLVNLRALTEMRKLNLMGTAVTDSGLENLSAMSELEELNLYRTKVTNSGLERLKSMKHLRAVDLRYTRATRAGVEVLNAALPNCHVLFLDFSSRPAGFTNVPELGTDRSEESIAKWIHSVGGKVSLAEGPIKEVSLAATLVSDKQMNYLLSLKGLRKLELQATEIGDPSTQELGQLTGLTELDMSSTLVSDSGLKHFLTLPKLRKLSLNHTLVQGQGFENFERLEDLSELHLTGAPVTNQGLKYIAALKHLERLSLNYSNITDAGVGYLQSLTRLTRLDLTGVDLGDEGLSLIKGLENLTELLLSHGRFTDKGLKHLERLSKLTHLDLVRTQIGDSGLEAISKLKNLRSLNLDYTGVTDAGLVHLSSLGQLTELHLDNAKITDEGIVPLMSLSHLKTLNLYHTLVTDRGFEMLKAALPECQIIWDRDSALPNRRGS